jgi:hypothetical protein
MAGALLRLGVEVGVVLDPTVENVLDDAALGDGRFRESRLALGEAAVETSTRIVAERGLSRGWVKEPGGGQNQEQSDKQVGTLDHRATVTSHSIR